MRSIFRMVARGLIAATFFGLLLVGLQAGSATRGTASATPTPGPQPTPEQVTVGVYVQNVQAVDLSTNSFSADFYIWLRWRNPDIDAPAGGAQGQCGEQTGHAGANHQNAFRHP